MAVDATQIGTPESSEAPPMIDLGPDPSIYPESLRPSLDPVTETEEVAQSETPVVEATAEAAPSVDQAAQVPEGETAPEPSRRERTRLLKAEEEEQVRADERAKYTAQIEQAQTL